MRLCYLLLPLLWLVACTTDTSAEQSTQDPPPNIVILYVDDLGYGDLGCYGATGVKTPYIDSLAANGIRFTDAHCAAATCTPSRYALLTGRYAFRNEAAVLPGDAPLIIDTSLITLPKMLKAAGYTTAVVGKWHLGLGDGELDWNGLISPGPREVGFDYSFLLPATGDRVPTVYVENDRVVGLDVNDPLSISYSEAINNEPTGISNPELLRYPADEQHAKSIVNGVSRIGFQSGGKAAMWTDEDFPDRFTERANNFIREHAKEPFFLYFPFHDIHVPRLPHPRFKGTSNMGPRGDAIAQVDWMTGQIVQQLRESGVLDNTLIIFTSDNGPVLNDGYEDGAIEQLGNHQPAGEFRGGKYSIFEGGTRVPTIVYAGEKVRMVSKVAMSTKSEALLSQVDLLRSLAGLVYSDSTSLATLLTKIPDIDSQDQLPAWLGQDSSGRTELIEEGVSLALRTNRWKYIAPSWPGKAQWIAGKGIESGISAYPQLYDMAKDPGEMNNLATRFPEQLAQLDERLRGIVGTDKTKRLDLVSYDYDTSQWIELIGLEPGIQLDLRYATANNFMKQQIYDCARCFYRKPVAEALAKVHRELTQQGLGLKMFDCYRPAPFQQKLWDILPDARYVARPSKGSLHSRGAATDLTVIDLRTGEELPMGSPYDFFGEAAYTTTTDLPREVLENRALFQTVMRKYGFGTIRTEWWHFNFLGPRLELADWLWECE